MRPRGRSQLGSQQLHGARPIFQLRPFLGAEDADAGGLMRQVDRRLDFIHILTCTRTRHESDEPRHLPYHS